MGEEKMKQLLLILTISSLAACGRVDLDSSPNTSIAPAPGGFTFRTFADTMYPADSAGAEQDRMASLTRFATANGYCPTGYDIVDRRVIKRPPTVLGIDTQGEIIYAARCR